MCVCLCVCVCLSESVSCVCVFIVAVWIDTHSHISHDAAGKSPPEPSELVFSSCRNSNLEKTSAPDNTHTHTHTHTNEILKEKLSILLLNTTTKCKSQINVAFFL